MSDMTLVGPLEQTIRERARHMTLLPTFPSPRVVWVERSKYLRVYATDSGMEVEEVREDTMSGVRREVVLRFSTDMAREFYKAFGAILGPFPEPAPEKQTQGTVE